MVSPSTRFAIYEGLQGLDERLIGQQNMSLCNKFWSGTTNIWHNVSNVFQWGKLAYRDHFMWIYNISRCDGVHVVLYTWGGKWHLRGCTQPKDPNCSIQQLFCCTLVTLPFFFSKIVIFKHYYIVWYNSSLFPRTRGCFVLSAENRPTVGSMKVMYTG